MKSNLMLIKKRIAWHPLMFLLEMLGIISIFATGLANNKMVGMWLIMVFASFDINGKLGDNVTVLLPMTDKEYLHSRLKVSVKVVTKYVIALICGLIFDVMLVSNGIIDWSVALDSSYNRICENQIVNILFYILVISIIYKDHISIAANYMNKNKSIIRILMGVVEMLATCTIVIIWISIVIGFYGQIKKVIGFDCNSIGFLVWLICCVLAVWSSVVYKIREWKPSDIIISGEDS